MTGSASSARQASALAGENPVKASWVLPALAAAMVLGCLLYIRTAELDSIEARSLTTETLLTALREHIWLVAVSTVTVIGIGVPLGVLLSRPAARFIQTPVLAIANAGQAIPSIGVLVLLAIIYNTGFAMAVVSLVLYALLPILRNTMVGLKQVEPHVIDAARGMGMGRLRLLLTVELPLAVPVMLAGIRVALILNVGVATLATYTNAGGLGDLIERGIVNDRMPILVTGCLLTIALALTIDWLAGLAETRLRPKGL